MPPSLNFPQLDFVKPSSGFHPVTWERVTSPKEGITLLELFSGIGTSLESLLKSRMVVRRYFYIDIDPIAKQMVTSRMMELTTIFSQQFTTTTWKVSFTFLPSNIQLIQKNHMELLGPWTSSFQVGNVKDFQWSNLEKT